MRSLVSASALTCLLLPAAAQAFPIDLEAHLDGVTIETRTTDISNIATVTLRNAGANTALCEATFVNGPERPAPRRVCQYGARGPHIPMLFRMVFRSDPAKRAFETAFP